MKMIRHTRFRSWLGERLVWLGCRITGWKPNECVVLVLIDLTPSEVGLFAASLLHHAPLPKSVGILVPDAARDVFVEALEDPRL